MASPPDIIVETPGRRTVLMADCKFEPNGSAAVATRLRNRFLTDGYLDVPSDAFFMLVVPSKLHLWKPGAATDALPDRSADSLPVLRNYLGTVAEDWPWPGGDVMRFAVSCWLGDLTCSIYEPSEADADQMLVDTGLYELMKHGSIRRDFEP